MSSNKDILPPEIARDKGSLHPINHMKDSIMNDAFGLMLINQDRS